jgi:hypothetical protein
MAALRSATLYFSGYHKDRRQEIKNEAKRRAIYKI